MDRNMVGHSKFGPNSGPTNHGQEHFRKELSFLVSDVLIQTLPHVVLKSTVLLVSVLMVNATGTVNCPSALHMVKITLDIRGQ